MELEVEVRRSRATRKAKALVLEEAIRLSTVHCPVDPSHQLSHDPGALVVSCVGCDELVTFDKLVFDDRSSFIQLMESEFDGDIELKVLHELLGTQRKVVAVHTHGNQRIVVTHDGKQQISFL